MFPVLLICAFLASTLSLPTPDLHHAVREKRSLCFDECGHLMIIATPTDYEDCMNLCHSRQQRQIDDLQEDSDVENKKSFVLVTPQVQEENTQDPLLNSCSLQCKGMPHPFIPICQIGCLLNLKIDDTPAKIDVPDAAA